MISSVAGGLIQEKPGYLIGDKAQETIETLFDFESYTTKTHEDCSGQLMGVRLQFLKASRDSKNLDSRRHIYRW